MSTRRPIPARDGFFRVAALSGRSVAVETAAMTAAMAAPGPVGRTAQRLEGTVSNESSITARTQVPVVSPESLDLPVSPVQVSELPSKNLWEQICGGKAAGPAEEGRDSGGPAGLALPGCLLCARRLTCEASREPRRGPAGLPVLRAETETLERLVRGYAARLQLNP